VLAGGIVKAWPGAAFLQGQRFTRYAMETAILETFAPEVHNAHDDVPMDMLEVRRRRRRRSRWGSHFGDDRGHAS
jgi:hypothetical protein